VNCIKIKEGFDLPQLSRPHWKEREGPAANARRALPALVSGYFEQARAVLGEPPGELHGLRLATKRIRYSLELFRPVYGPGLETRLAELRKVQQLLGDVADSTATRKKLAKSAGQRVDDFLDQRAEAQAEAFRKYWSETFDAPGREAWWTGYLARAARPAPRR
jgi:CHAD domain-containing protein